MAQKLTLIELSGSHSRRGLVENTRSVGDFFSNGEAIGPVECLHPGVLENHGNNCSFHKPSELGNGKSFHGRSVKSKLKGSLASIMEEKSLMRDIVRPHVMKLLSQALANDFNFQLKLILNGTQGSSSFILVTNGNQDPVERLSMR